MPATTNSTGPDRARLRRRLLKMVEAFVAQNPDRPRLRRSASIALKPSSSRRLVLGRPAAISRPARRPPRVSARARFALGAGLTITAPCFRAQRCRSDTQWQEKAKPASHSASQPSDRSLPVQKIGRPSLAPGIVPAHATSTEMITIPPPRDQNHEPDVMR